MNTSASGLHGRGVETPRLFVAQRGRQCGWLARPLASLAVCLIMAGLSCGIGVYAAEQMAKPETMTISGLGIKMVKVPKGSFLMGNPEAKGNNDEGPAHQVTLTKDFWMGATTITVGQWRHFVDTTGYVTEAEWNNQGIFVKRDTAGPVKYLNWRHPGIPNYNQTEEGPVVGISWRDTQQFLTWLNERERAAGRLPDGYVYRLPTEAQWEYAARAGTTGDLEDPDGHAWYVMNSGGVPHPVGTKKPNAFGLYDMYGNVWNWVHDWYGRYPSEPVVDPEGPATQASPEIIRPLRELRGGTWNDPTGHGLSPANRWATWGIHAGNWISFRIALAPPPPPIPVSTRDPYPPDGPPSPNAAGKKGKKKG
jgi:formylglycine-generating enzyme required for sulfatase activity